MYQEESADGVNIRLGDTLRGCSDGHPDMTPTGAVFAGRRVRFTVDPSAPGGDPKGYHSVMQFPRRGG